MIGLILVGLSDTALRASAIVNFKSYVSGSGQYTLEVDPSEICGRGAGHYRMRMGGREAWSKTLPFTLYDAAVLNDGTSIGYAYDHGLDGFALKGGFKAGAGNIHVVVLDPKGDVRLDEVSKRKFSMALHAPPEPVVRGILLQEDQDRFTIRTATERGENWWVYKCSTGKPITRFDLHKTSSAPTTTRFVQAIRTIPETPLILVSWLAVDATKQPDRRTIFTLITPEGHCVWTREIPAQDNVSREENAERQLQGAIDKTGLILDTAKPGRFELWFVAESQGVLFGVIRDKTLKQGWRIKEIERQPYQPKTEDSRPGPSIENRPLPLLGSFKLEGDAPDGPIHDIDSFEFDSEGRIGVIRQNPPTSRSFVLLDAAGVVLAEVPVPESAYDAGVGQVSAASVGLGKWVLVASEPKQEARSWAWWFDLSEKRLSKPVPLVCPDITAVAGTGDGGFVVLAKRRSQYSSVNEMHAFDRQGAHMWALVEGNNAEPKSLFSPEDITVTSKGDITVLDNIRKTVQFFSLDGKFLRVVDLKKRWKREPNYPSKILPDVDGGFIVCDFGGDPPFVRMKVDGMVRDSLRPRHPNGRLIDPAGGLQVAPDGRLWASDQHALYRLDENGVADLTLGRTPQPEDLDKIAVVTGDRNGNIYAVDERTGAVHVFDTAGKKLRICKPIPGDFKENLRSPCIAVADDGSVYLGEGAFSTNAPRYLHFGPDGSRLGFQDFKVDHLERVSIQPGTDNFLLTAYPFAALIGPDGKVVKDIERRADRLWLDFISGCSFARDGSFAIQSDQLVSNGLSINPAITLFDRAGTPVRTFPLPGNLDLLVGYNGSHVVLWRDKGIEIYDHDGVAVQTFPLPNASPSTLFLTREGRELWSVNVTTRTVQRYAMP